MRRPTMTRFGFAGLLPVIVTLLCALIMLLPLGSGAANVTMPHLALISVFFWISNRPLLMPYGACLLLGLVLDLWLNVPLGLNMAMLLLTRLFVMNQLKYYKGRSIFMHWGAFVLLSAGLYAGAWGVTSLTARDILPPAPIFLQWLVTAFSYGPMVVILLQRVRKMM